MATRQQLANVIAERTMRSGNSKRLSKEVAAYLLAENKAAEVDSIIRDVIAYRAAHDLVEVTVVSAYPINSTVRQDITKLLKELFPNAKSFSLNERIDQSVVGGVRLEMANQQIDFTVRAKLNTLKRLTAARKDI